MGRLKAGFLLPYSGVFTSLKTDFRQGFDMALQDKNIIVEACVEFIQSGARKTVEEALRKLVLFENVDLVTGVVGTKVMMQIIPFMDAQRVPVIINNLGADLPTGLLRSEYLFYNSLHLWKSQWVMGKWAQKKYGGEPSINISLYESGYSLHECFKMGAVAAGAQTLKLNIMRNITGVADTRALVGYLRDQQPRHAHVLLSGSEGAQFLDLFYQSGLDQTIALSVNPFITGESQAGEKTNNGSRYSAITWYKELPSPANRLFMQLYADDYGEQPNVFSLLGYETGLALAAAVREINEPVSKQVLAAALAKTTPEGPRGKMQLSTCPLQTWQPVYIQHRDDAGGCRVVGEDTGIEWNHPSQAGSVQNVSGWENPYMCI